MAGRYGYRMPYGARDTSNYDLATSLVTSGFGAAREALMRRKQEKEQRAQQQQDAAQSTATDSSLAAIMSGADPRRILSANPQLLSDGRLANAMAMVPQQPGPVDQGALNKDTAVDSYLSAIASGADPSRMASGMPSLLGDDRLDKAIELGKKPEPVEPEPEAVTDWKFHEINGVPHRVDLATGVAEPLSSGGKAFQPPTSEAPTVDPLGDLSVDQSKNLGFAMRMQEAETLLAETTESGDPLDMVGASVGEGIRGLGGNLMRSSDHQRYEQAKENFARAMLRRESGAQLAADEIAGMEETFFPQVGDSPEVIEQKRQSRKIALIGLTITLPAGAWDTALQQLNPGASTAAGSGSGAPDFDNMSLEQIPAGPDLNNLGGMSMQQLESMASDPTLTDEQLQRLSAEWDRRNG